MIAQMKCPQMPRFADVSRSFLILMNGLFLLNLFLPAATRAQSASVMPLKADSVLVKKSERRLYLMKNGKAYRGFHVALGKDPQGAKLFEGDNRTPEGDYVLDQKNSDSQFYKSIHISYPNQEDTDFANVVGSCAGGGIMIHGSPEDPEYPSWLYSEFDWTDGCIAVSNAAMDEIWASVDEGTPIRILP